MQHYIIGNWKMNGTKAEAKKIASGLLKRVQEAERVLPHIIMCPSYPYLGCVFEILKDSPLAVGGQDCNPEKGGSFTGDVSVSQLVDIGCRYVIVGHSERRHYHQEGGVLIKRKTEAVLKAGLRPILCVGEQALERKEGKTLSVISDQLSSNLPREISHDLLIAYEPVWAIGTGLTPTLKEIAEVMGFLKHELSSRMPGGALIPILYGGSVSSLNASALLNLVEVNGLLVGGASLNLDEFWQIITASRQ